MINSRKKNRKSPRIVARVYLKNCNIIK